MHRPVTPKHLGASRLALALTLAWPLLGQAQGPICHCYQIAPVLPPTDSDIEITQAVDAAPAAAPLLTRPVVATPTGADAKPVMPAQASAPALQPLLNAVLAPDEIHQETIDSASAAQHLAGAASPQGSSVARSIASAPAAPSLATKTVVMAPAAPAQMTKVMYQPSPRSAHELVEALIPPTAAEPIAAAELPADSNADLALVKEDAAPEPSDLDPVPSQAAIADVGTDLKAGLIELPLPANAPAGEPEPVLFANREFALAEDAGPVDGPSAPPLPAEPPVIANKEIAQADHVLPADSPAAPPDPRDLPEPQLATRPLVQAQLALPLDDPGAPPELPAAQAAASLSAPLQIQSAVPVNVAAPLPQVDEPRDIATASTASPAAITPVADRSGTIESAPVVAVDAAPAVGPASDLQQVAQVQLSLPFESPVAPVQPAQTNQLAADPAAANLPVLVTETAEDREIAQAQPVAPAASAAAQTAPASPDNGIDLRRPNGAPPIQDVIPDIDPSQVPPPTPLLPRESLPLPDRWRIVETLGMKDDPLNPYAQNLLKGDKPIPAGFGLGPDWFINLGLISDTLLETHNIPTPISSSGVINASAVDQLGRGTQSIFNQTFLFSASLIKGDTTFKPPDYEIRIVPAFNGNIVHAEESGALEANPAAGLTRRDDFAGLQEAYLETHLRNVSDRYDFDSVRIGIQPFTSDFRGFVFQDDAFGIRFFGNRDNNTWQYNLAWLQRIEKDTNSGLNDITAPLRKDTTFIANLYHQDFPIQGNTTQVTVMHNMNHDEDQYVDADGFQTRPAEVGDGEAHKYDVTYVGLNTDGHFGRWNLTSSFYGAFGHDSHNPIAQRAQTIQAGFAAAELSRDFDWIRVRASAVYATGDRDVNDGKSTGFDAILENPDIAGAGTSFWIRQAIPLIGGGGVALNGRDGLLPDLRSSKDDGQSNFVNPGLILLGMGADADITPNLRVLANFSHLSFDSTAVLEALRAQGNISRDIGWDLSTALQYRPFLTQNIVFSASLATLIPGDGFKELYNTQRLGLPYSILFNMVLRY